MQTLMRCQELQALLPSPWGMRCAHAHCPPAHLLTLNSTVVPGGSDTSADHTWPSSQAIQGPLSTCGARCWRAGGRQVGATGLSAGALGYHIGSQAGRAPNPRCLWRLQNLKISLYRPVSRRTQIVEDPDCAKAAHLPIAQRGVAAHQTQHLAKVHLALGAEAHAHGIVAAGGAAQRQRARGASRQRCAQGQRRAGPGGSWRCGKLASAATCGEAWQLAGGLGGIGGRHIRRSYADDRPGPHLQSTAAPYCGSSPGWGPAAQLHAAA